MWWGKTLIASYPQALLLSGRLAGLYTHIYTKMRRCALFTYMCLSSVDVVRPWYRQVLLIEALLCGISSSFIIILTNGQWSTPK